MVNLESTREYFCTLNSSDKPDIVISFLYCHTGLSPPQLCAFIHCRPTVLAVDVYTNLLPKLKLLEPLLPSPSPTKDLTYLATTSASTFGYSATHLAPAINLLRSLLPPSEPRAAIAALCRCSWVLTIKPNKILSCNVNLLHHCGLDPSAIIEKAPNLLILKLDILDAPFVAMEEDLSIASSSDCYLDAVNLVASMPKEDLLKKMKMLANYGFS
ncbi:uncharacterized protein [Elaeis guineensis]|uniref:uncharacterized protein n=1 Tax=Elaeis guineensis var. tenera TaxID=51953 RepID=UPI003C6D4240